MLLTGEIAQRREAYCLALDHSLKRVLKQLRAIREVEKVILFGSYANGRRDLFTDVDLLVVTKSNQDFVARTAGLYQMLDVKVDLDLIVYTPEEFERQRQSSFVQHVLKTGKVVYEKDPTRRR